MNKKFILPIALLALVSLAFLVSAYTCSDSDGGLDYYNYGELTYEDGGSRDVCCSDCDVSGTLYERFCNNGLPKEMPDTQPYVCPNGCSDGACLAEQQASTEDITIQIKKGWNLVPAIIFAGTEEANVDITLTGKDMPYIYLYIPDKNKYLLVSKDGFETEEGQSIHQEMASSRDAKLIYGRLNGMWIYAKKAGTIKIKNYDSLENSLPDVDEYYFEPFWQFAVISPYLKGKTLNEVKNDCVFSKIVKWDNANQKLVTLDSNYVTFTPSEVGSIYAFKSTNSCNFEESSTAPPTLP